MMELFAFRMMSSKVLFAFILFGGIALNSSQLDGPDTAKVASPFVQGKMDDAIPYAEMYLNAVPANMEIPYANMIEPASFTTGKYIITDNITQVSTFPKELTCDYAANVKVIADNSIDLLSSLEKSSILSIHAELTNRLASRMPSTVSRADLSQAVLAFLREYDSNCPADFYVDYNPRRYPLSLFRAKCRLPRTDLCTCRTFSSIETVYYFLGFTPSNVPVWQMVPTAVEVNCDCNPI